jgi:hypothetical protein
VNKKPNTKQTNKQKLTRIGRLDFSRVGLNIKRVGGWGTLYLLLWVIWFIMVNMLKFERVKSVMKM